MFFSIVIPLYNRPQEIKELLESLVQQTYKNFEVLVIEDGSVNDAKEIVQSFQQELDIHYYFKANEGQGFARNLGFTKAKGDYFIVFDSDCLIPSDYLANVKQELDNNWLDAFGGPDDAHESFTPIQKAISYSMTSVFTTGGIRGKKKNAGGQFHPRSFNMGISKKVWEIVGGFIITRLGEDIEYSVRIHEAGFKIGLIANAKVYHKRRTSFKQFWKQLHFFPALFTLFFITTILLNVFSISLAIICNSLLLTYIFLIFVDSFIKNKSLNVAFLSVIASLIQLTAYGFGFLQDYLKSIIIK